MGALGATEGHTARTDQRATWEEAGRSARSRPRETNTRKSCADSESADRTRSCRLLPVRLAKNSMDLGSRRWRESDENDDAITARIPTDGVDVEVGFPVVNGPNVAGLIYVDIGATHGRDEAWRRRWIAVTVRGHAVMYQQFAVWLRHCTACRRLY